MPLSAGREWEQRTARCKSSCPTERRNGCEQMLEERPSKMREGKVRTVDVVDPSDEDRNAPSGDERASLKARVEVCLLVAH